MGKESILVIEDEKNIAELIRYNLSEQGYVVSVEAAGDAGLERARKSRPDLILLDLMLPGMDGLSVCKALKQNEKTSSIPVIMVTAKSEEIDKIVGLEIGADDYMTKPFSPRELAARVKAVLRRGKEMPTDFKIKLGSLELDDSRHEVLLKGKPVVLTSKEYDLLKALLEARGRVLSREVLLEKVWGYDQSLEIETRTVDMHVGQLRKKMKLEADRLVTVKNVGYRLEPDADV
ncbi:MAG: DNA-binding response regulator [Omnitrophica bacterium GWA2_52_12]|nr:MAG: DNA-binding response regulator [Omnitrophica bacterium GWA2_52_12]